MKGQREASYESIEAQIPQREMRRILREEGKERSESIENRFLRLSKLLRHKERTKVDELGSFSQFIGNNSLNFDDGATHDKEMAIFSIIEGNNSFEMSNSRDLFSFNNETSILPE